MGLNDTVSALRHWWTARRRRWVVGDGDVADARRLADAERERGDEPLACRWLDERTVRDLDMALVFGAIDRTTTPVGAQALWRWLVAPAVRLDVVAERERGLARLADPGLRARIRDALQGMAAADAPYLPRLLWEPATTPRRIGVAVALAAALVVVAVLAVWWPPLVVVCVVLLAGNVLVSEREHAQLAHEAHAMGVLCQVLAAAERLQSVWPDESIRRELAAFRGLPRRVAWLSAGDPLGLTDLVRAGLQVRTIALARWGRIIDRDRERLRRLVLWVGEVDALASVASLRAERADARVPSLRSTASPEIVAVDIAHPAIAGAVGNDLAVAAGLLVTGSNMSGKSTFLRTLAVNAICAQSIHTTFGGWSASLVRVHAVMRVTDATAAGTSTYAAEVAAVGALVDRVSVEADGVPALFVVDEPFHGTSPALRVPIVVSVLEYLVERDLVVAATHDLEVAEQVTERFARGHFAEADAEAGTFDRRLRAGVSPRSNAVAMLVRAGYPAKILRAIEARRTQGPRSYGRAPRR